MIDPAPKLLVYYFGFPHYRRQILEALLASPTAHLGVVSGSSQKSSIETLTTAEIPQLRMQRTRSFGPLLWDRGVVSRATSDVWDVVILGPATTSLSTWATLVGRRVCGRTTILWGQCGRQGDRGVKRALQELMNRLANGLLVYGAAEAHAAQEWGTPAAKVRIVNNATESNSSRLTADFGREAFSRMQSNAADAKTGGRLRVAFFGRLNTDKKLDVLLDAARLLKQQFAALTVDVVGGGDAEEELRRSYPDDWITFHGWLYDGPERERIFREATLVASPFHMGLLAVDALRFGVPVLIPDNPRNGSEVESLTEGVNAIRFERGSATALARAAERWLEVAHSVDEQLFVESRTRALRAWEPAAVAGNIIEATIDILRSGGSKYLAAGRSNPK